MFSTKNSRTLFVWILALELFHHLSTVLHYRVFVYLDLNGAKQTQAPWGLLQLNKKEATKLNRSLNGLQRPFARTHIVIVMIGVMVIAFILAFVLTLDIRFIMMMNTMRTWRLRAGWYLWWYTTVVIIRMSASIRIFVMTGMVMSSQKLGFHVGYDYRSEHDDY